MRLSDFEWEQVSFQVDYATAFLLWDKAGHVWQRLSEMFEGLTIETAGPAQVVGKFGDSRVGVELLKAYWIVLRPDMFGSETLPAQARALLDLVTQQIAVNEFSRVGCRVQYARKYATLDGAAEAFLSLGLVNVPSGANFGLKDPKFGLSEYRLTQRGLSTAVSVTIKCEERHVRVSPPFGTTEIETKDFRSHRVVLDADFFTLAPMLRSQLETAAWLGAAMRVMRRDLKKFIGDE